jgi:protein SCO1/2
MDHSAGAYVYDAKGQVRLYHRYNNGQGAQGLANDIRLLLAE